MKLFVINLDRQPERLRRMESLFEGFGLRFSRVSAVDGQRLSEDEILRWQSSDAGSRPLRAGETACFLSHRECWRRIVEEGLSWAAIFEDDLHLGADAAALLRDGAWVPEEADVVKIETKLQYARVDKAAAGAVNGRALHRLRSKHAGAGGYIVTCKGAEKLLEMSGTFPSPADQFIFNLDLPSAASLAIYQLLPAVCVQDFVVKEPTMIVGLGSDLHDERTGEKLKGLGKLWREIKRPFLQVCGHVARFFSDVSSDKKWVFVRFT
jgi:glycosyl transferase family 25